MKFFIRGMCFVIGIIVLGFLLFNNAKIKTLDYTKPLSDLVMYDSSTLLIRDTVEGTPSFLFLFRPYEFGNDYSVFYVETGLGGKIKRFTGPFVTNSTIDPAAVRATILDRKKYLNLQSSP